MKRLLTCVMVAMLFIHAPPARGAEPTASRPNIVFIMTDDQRWDALSCTGHPFLKTPNIDRLASEGALFQNYFVTLSLCSPSRACILTGQYAHKNGIINNSDHSAESHKL